MCQPAKQTDTSLAFSTVHKMEQVKQDPTFVHTTIAGMDADANMVVELFNCNLFTGKHGSGAVYVVLS